LLGGIGPEATGNFYLKLISGLQEKGFIKNNSDFPNIIINSIPVTELVKAKATKREIQEYINGLKEIEKHEVDFSAMICNTINLFFEEIQKEINHPIINLQLEVKNKILEQNQKVLVIGSPLTMNKLYSFGSITKKPNSKEQKILAKSIFLFNKGYEKEKQISKTKNICEKYLKKDIDFILTACTEFSIMLKDEEIPKIDPLEILVEKVIENFQEQKFKKVEGVDYYE
jgi:aspartate/glutamate racemase